MPRKKSIEDMLKTPNIDLSVFTIPDSGTSKSKRDKKRAFTQTQKNEILHQQDNKCAICHKKLDPRTTEFDHEKPWSANGKTITQNGRALHAECHKIVGHNHRLEKIEGKKSAKKTEKTKTKKKTTKKPTFRPFIDSPLF